MSKKGPIILIEDDEDDQLLIKMAIKNLNVVNPIWVFHNGQEALEYLERSVEQPFLILCDINMPLLNGLELRAVINQHKILREKSIPFVFLTTTASAEAIRMAYDESVQGFYQKENSQAGLQQQLKLIIDYWQSCLHPNSLL
ncbi:response regulator [Spirosoma pollinicola]|uniref:Response regulator n=1 Tax=Spirosoma pollinicola TaxID=2057025 RepID=A0A2K8Z1E3_9BACT|nr:response regulator [Spirosoma pollinicola]AUD03634.1 response regulator [Spirosoma pollinicola]